MNIIYNKKHDYVMCYVPKAGCSLMRKIYKDFHEDEYSSWDGLNFSSLFVTGNDKPQVYATSNKFILVRNPYKRVLSAYYDKFLHVQGSQTTLSVKFVNLFKLYCITKDAELVATASDNDELHRLSPSLKSLIRKAKLPINLGDVPDDFDTSFRRYLEFLKFFKANGIFNLEEHHELQCFYPYPGWELDRILKDIYVMDIERLPDGVAEFYGRFLSEGDLARIKELTAQNLKVHANRNSTAPKKDLRGSISATTHGDEIVKLATETNTLPDHFTMFDPDTESLFYEIFAKDFTVFNYKRMYEK